MEREAQRQERRLLSPAFDLQTCLQTHPAILTMTAHVSPAFRQLWNVGFKAYRAGQFLIARKCFSCTRYMLGLPMAHQQGLLVRCLTDIQRG